MLPNNGTVEGATEITPIPVREKFTLAFENAFDPFVIPFVGFTAGVAQISGQEASFGFGASGYAKRYGLAFADNTIGDIMTSAVMPSLLRQDPRYFQLGTGRAAHRFGYAASRVLITRSDAGHRQFNWSDVGGNAISAGLSDLYYPSANRHLSDTATRWGTEVLWDALANELKEFWPDIRRKIRKS